MAHRSPADLKAGDVVTLAGRTETVRDVTEEADWVHVYVINDDGDPYLVRPHDTVPVHSR
ncbi:hypothetical protein ACFC7A_26870 [Streptomyces niveus]|uniref:hypothetical protein n=1 Tax=Streptomyces niveus TaxID=193462 RepID=UPI0035E22AED